MRRSEAKPSRGAVEPPYVRPSVSVVVPFRGDEDAASRLRRTLGTLRRAQGDELIVADNTDEGVAGPTLAPVAKVVRATSEPSSYHARNCGARPARGDWILFLDAVFDAYRVTPTE